MKYLKINGKDYYEYEKDDFDLSKWYIFTDLGSEGTSRSEAFKTKKEATFYFDGGLKRGFGKGVYQRNRSYVMTGKTAIENGFDEWCYEVDN